MAFVPSNQILGDEDGRWAVAGSLRRLHSTSPKPLDNEGHKGIEKITPDEAFDPTGAVSPVGPASVIPWYSYGFPDLISGEVAFPAIECVSIWVLAILGAVAIRQLEANGTPTRPAVALPFVDAMFLSVSALVNCGLATTDISALTTGTHVTLLALTVIGHPVLVSLALVLLRRGYLARQLKRDLVPADRDEISSELCGYGWLLFLVPSYFLMLAIIGTVILGAYLTSSRADVTANIPPFWYAFFATITALCNTSFSLSSNPGTGVTYSDACLNIVMAFLLIAGGVGFPVLLRLLVAAAARSPVSPGDRAALHLMLNKSHVHYVYLASRVRTAQLAAVSGLAAAIGACLFLILEYKHAALAALTPWDRFLAAGFLAISARHAGFVTIPLGRLTGAMQAVYALLMLLPAGFVPFVPLGPPTRQSQPLTAWAIRIVLMTALVIVILAVENDTMLANSAISIWSVLFEAVSALTGGGFSLGFQPTYGTESFAAVLSCPSKVMIMLLMTLGRYSRFVSCLTSCRWHEAVLKGVPHPTHTMFLPPSDTGQHAPGEYPGTVYECGDGASDGTAVTAESGDGGNVEAQGPSEHTGSSGGSHRHWPQALPGDEAPEIEISPFDNLLGPIPLTPTPLTSLREHFAKQLSSPPEAIDGNGDSAAAAALDEAGGEDHALKPQASRVMRLVSSEERLSGTAMPFMSGIAASSGARLADVSLLFAAGVRVTTPGRKRRPSSTAQESPTLFFSFPVDRGGRRRFGRQPVVLGSEPSPSESPDDGRPQGGEGGAWLRDADQSPVESNFMSAHVASASSEEEDDVGSEGSMREADSGDEPVEQEVADGVGTSVDEEASSGGEDLLAANVPHYAGAATNRFVHHLAPTPLGEWADPRRADGAQADPSPAEEEDTAQAEGDAIWSTPVAVPSPARSLASRTPDTSLRTPVAVADGGMAPDFGLGGRPRPDPRQTIMDWGRPSDGGSPYGSSGCAHPPTFLSKQSPQLYGPNMSLTGGGTIPEESEADFLGSLHSSHDFGSRRSTEIADGTSQGQEVPQSRRALLGADGLPHPHGENQAAQNDLPRVLTEDEILTVLASRPAREAFRLGDDGNTARTRLIGNLDLQHRLAKAIDAAKPDEDEL